MNITPVVRKFLTHRMRSIERYTDHAEDIQRGVLRRLVNAAEHTAYGKAFQFDKIRLYENFAQRVPLNDYDSLKPYIERMRHGEPDVLWKGHVHWFAKSSGTTHDKSKFIPVSPRGLKHIHYKGGTDSVAIYLHRHNPESRLFEGKALILGGSHQPDASLPQSLAGDLSAILLENTSSFVNHFRVPSKPTALLSDFEQKRLKIAEETVGQNVTNLSGVPSWMMGVIRTVLETTGASTLDEVWPNLEVFFHGGVAFTPYREQYKQLIRSPRMRYMETYNASEGFFGLQSDPADLSMLLMLDYGVFYEFIPLEEVGRADATVLPLWEVEAGRNYAIVISTSCGLWRYQIGDTVRFTSTRPYKFVISGRTKCFINAFGEELIVDNAEKGLQEACRQTGAVVAEYTAAPVFMDAKGQCRHQWVVEFAKAPADLQAFAQILDQALQQINSDYEAKRYKDLTLQQLEIIPARPGLFNDWLKSKGKLGGQHKVPRLANNRDIIEEVLAAN